MDIVFASSKGAQYRYFRSLCKGLNIRCGLVTLRPVFFPSVFDSGLSFQVISDGVEFHVERKKRKYFNYRIPDLFWKLYGFRAGLKFVKIYLRFSSYFKLNSPQVVGLWNGHRLPEMAIKAAASYRDVKVLHFENGLLPGTTTADFCGVNAFNSVPRDIDFYRRYLSSSNVNSYIGNNLEVRASHKNRVSIKREVVSEIKNYIFVPFQVNFDSQVVINSPWINSMEQYFQLINAIIGKIEDDSLCFVIKEHPSDPRVYSEFHGVDPRVVFSTDSTEKLIRNSKAVMTLNSSVGLEALMLEKALIVLGEACFNVGGLVLTAESEGQLVDVIDGLDHWLPNIELTRAYITYLYEDYCIPLSWQGLQLEMDYKHLSAIERKVVSQVKGRV